MKLLDVLTLEHYRELIEYPNVVRGMINTLGIGVIGGAFAVACYTAIALAVHRLELRLDARSSTTWSWCRAPCRGSSPALPCCGYSCSSRRYAAQVDNGLGLARLLHRLARLRHAACLRHAAAGRPELEEAARTAGASDLRVKRDVTVPLIRYGMLASWLLVFLIFVREYSTGIYLLGPGTEVIGSLLVSLWGTGAVDLVSRAVSR